MAAVSYLVSSTKARNPNQLEFPIRDSLTRLSNYSHCTTPTNLNVTLPPGECIDDTNRFSDFLSSTARARPCSVTYPFVPQRPGQAGLPRRSALQHEGSDVSPRQNHHSSGDN